VSETTRRAVLLRERPGPVARPTRGGTARRYRDPTTVNRVRRTSRSDFG